MPLSVSEAIGKLSEALWIKSAHQGSLALACGRYTSYQEIGYPIVLVQFQPDSLTDAAVH